MNDEQAMAKLQESLDYMESVFPAKRRAATVELLNALRRGITALRADAEREKGCAFCDEEHDQHDYMNGVQTFENGKYLVLETSEWDEYDDCFNDVRIRIGFCPMCGKRLEGK